jgi:hypothetical protein
MLEETGPQALSFIQRSKQKIFMNLVPVGVALGAGLAN